MCSLRRRPRFVLGPAGSVGVVLASLALTLGCAAPAGPPGAASAPSTPLPPASSPTEAGTPGQPPSQAPAAVPAHCQARGALPDPVCTPGADNPAVTQQSISSTICRPGYSRGVRPPLSVTAPLKRALMTAYGSTLPAAQVELDHLVALEDGGAPEDPRNLWPQPRSGPPGQTAGAKDAVETSLHDRICSGRVPLAAARSALARDWTTALAAVGG